MGFNSGFKGLMCNFFLFLIILCAFLLWWYSCTSFSLLAFINHLSLAFFISSIAILHSSSYHLFFNVSVLSSFSISCCFFPLVIVLMFSHFLFISLSILSSSSIFSNIPNLLLSSITYFCFYFEFWKLFTVFLFSLYFFSLFTLNFNLKFIGHIVVTECRKLKTVVFGSRRTAVFILKTARWWRKETFCTLFMKGSRAKRGTPVLQHCFLCLLFYF